MDKFPCTIKKEPCKIKLLRWRYYEAEYSSKNIWNFKTTLWFINKNKLVRNWSFEEGETIVKTKFIV